jgi:hypothetical protein
MKVKIKKPEKKIKAKEDKEWQNLLNDAIPLRGRTDERLKELLKNKGAEWSKKDAVEAIDYLKKELAHLKRYQSNVATCRLNLRTAVHSLDIGGYQSLGYSSLKRCLETELPETKSLSTLYREAKAAQLEVLLFKDGEIGKVKESVLRPLSKLKDNAKIKKAWKNAMAAKSEKSDFPTAEEVEYAIAELHEGKDEPEGLRWSKSCASDIRAFSVCL